MNDRFAPLGEDEVRNIYAGDEWTPVVPVPDGAPKALAAIDAFAKLMGMSRTGLWQYTDAEGRLLRLHGSVRSSKKRGAKRERI
jgi:hypothetical protein